MILSRSRRSCFNTSFPPSGLISMVAMELFGKAEIMFSTSAMCFLARSNLLRALAKGSDIKTKAPIGVGASWICLGHSDHAIGVCPMQDHKIEFYFSGLISAITSWFPFGKEMYKPELRADPSGISASSEYRNVHSATALSAKTRVAGNLVSGVKNGCSEETIIPSSRVKLVTKPDTVAFTEPSAEVNNASIRMRSVTNRCSSKLASSGEITLALMAERVGYKEAEFWCENLGTDGTFTGS